MAGEFPTAHLEKPSKRNYQIVWRVNGKPHVISAGTADRPEAERLLMIANGCLAQGQPVVLPKRKRPGPGMDWEDFREVYRSRRPRPTYKTHKAQENRLDFFETHVRLRTLADAVTHESQMRLREALIREFPSLHSAKSRLASIRAALRWAHERGYCAAPADVPAISTAKIKTMRGRPLTDKEFAAYLKAVVGVVGLKQAPSWKRLIQGIVATGFRLEETMRLHWTDTREITPDFTDKFPVWRLPTMSQKNRTEETIPMTEDCARLLKSTKLKDRLGWVFMPMPLRLVHKDVRNPDWISKVLVKVGKAAGIVTDTRRLKDGTEKLKYASAHDLRRTRARIMMTNRKISRDIVKKVMRHADIQTTIRWYADVEVQQATEELWQAERLQKAADKKKRKST